MEAQHKLTKIELVRETGGQYYLDVEYEVEDDKSIRKLIIPRVRLPFNDNVYPNITTSYPTYFTVYNECKICTGCDNDTSVEKHDGIFYKVEVLKEKEHELTIAEIEKKLGYKIKIVSEDKKK